MKSLISILVLLTSVQALSFEAIKCPHKKDKLEFVNIDVYDDNPKKGYLQAPENANEQYPHHWDTKSMKVWAVCIYGKDDRKRLMQKQIKKNVSTCEMKESVPDSQIFDILECQ